MLPKVCAQTPLRPFPNTELPRNRFTLPRYLNLIAVLFAALGPVLGAAQAAGQNLVLAPAIHTIAGSGTVGFSGDGGPAASAQLNAPLSDAVDTSGNVYFSDSSNHRVRRIDGATGVITTIAGTGVAGFSGDGGPAASAQLNSPGGLLLDAAGNLFIGDSLNNRVRKINLATGVIGTYAGNGTQGFSGDGGQATNAAFNYTDGLGLDAAGNLYIADRSNFRIRKVTTAGIVTTVVGNGTQGFAGDGGQATSAQIGLNWSVALDVKGNLYLADVGNQRIRKVTAAGVISTVGGNGTAGFAGDGGAATSAEINLAAGSSLDVDPAGNIYVADTANCRIREIAASTGVIQTIAGSGACGYSGDGSLASAAQLNRPQRIQYSAKTGLFVVSDTANNVLRSFATGTVTFSQTAVGGASATQTVFLQTTAAVSITSIAVAKSMDGRQEFTVGTITGCAVNGTTVPAGTICAVPITFTPGFAGPRTIPLTAVTSTGTIGFGLSGYGLGPQITVLDQGISTIAGTGTAGYAGDGGAATAAKLSAPRRIVFDPQGNLYFADYNNNVVRRIASGTGVITTVAGNGTVCSSSTAVCGDGGAATAANLNAPVGVVIDTNGNLYVSDSNDSRIRRINSATGVITTYVGTGNASYTGDGGLASAAGLNTPAAISLDQYNNLYIADSGNNVIREVDATTGLISTVAGNGTACASPTAACGDGGAATSANLNFAAGVAVDLNRNIYIADTTDNRIRFVSASTGILSTIAGTGTGSYSGDGGAAKNATLNGPRAVTVDGARNLYIADSANNVIRLVDNATGTIQTIAGTNATPCPTPTAACGDGGSALGANLVDPRGVTLDLDGNIYISDAGDNRLREISNATVAFAFAATPLGTTSTDSPKILSLLSSGSTPLTFTKPSSGTNPTISNNFTIGNASTCPQLSSSSGGSGTLAVGATCNYLLSFSPVAVGSISGSIVITDNSVNANFPAPTTQTISLTGTGTKGTPAQTLTSSNQNPLLLQSVTLTDTFAPVGGVLPTGTVTFYNGSALLGTGTINSSGVATLTTSQLPYGTDTITASYPGDSNFLTGTSNSVSETVGKAVSSSALSSSNLSLSAGQSVTLTDTVTSTNGVFPTGTVTFFNGTTSIGTGSVSPSGVATLATTSLPVGTDSITAAYGGDATFGPSTSNAITETVAKNSGTNTLTTSSSTPTFGQTVTLTDTLATVNGIVPTGTVTFSTGGVTLGTGTVNASGVATLSTSALAIGSDSVIAGYGGDSSNNASTSNVVNETVGKATSSGVVTTSNANPAFGQSVTLTDTLSSVNGVVPTGTVIFFNGTTSLGTATVNATGVATLATAALPAGTDAITATYGGNATYNSSTSAAIAETVTKGTISGTLTTSNASPASGQAVTFTDTLGSINGVFPTGTVTFFNGTSSLGSGTVNSSGVATLTTGALPVGTDAITAVYGGDASFNNNTSNALNENVTKNTGTNALSTSNASPAFGQTVTLTSTLSSANGLVPTGTVSFFNGSTLLGTGTVSGSGVATVATTALPVGTDSVTAVFGGDANFNTTTSNAVTETVAKGAAASTLSSSNAAPSYGMSITLTDTLAAVNGVMPTGTVTFYSGGTPLGTGTVNGSGVATLTMGTLPVGTDTVTAVYGGDSTYGSSTSSAVTETVAKNADTSVLGSSNTSPNYAASVTLTDTVSSVNGVAATGIVTFYSGSTSLGTGTLSSSGVATLTTSALAVGTDSLTAVYVGDTNYSTSTSNAVTETVSKLSGTNTLNTSNNSPSYGQAVTLTDTLQTANGVVPTGSVTFSSGGTVLGTGTVNSSGVATLTTGALPVGTNAISAVYSGDAAYVSSTSYTVTETVAKNAGSGNLSTSTAAPNYGQTVTLTDTLASVNGVIPTGTVTFFNGSATLGTGTVNSSGVATLATAALPIGGDSVTAVYSGNAIYSANTSNAVAETVGKGTAPGALTSSNGTPSAGQTVTFTDALPAVNGTVPTGTVSFYNGSTPLGTGAVNASGLASLATGSLPAGTDAVSAVYGGDANFSTNTSNTVTETVSKNAGTGTLISSNPSPSYGQTITLSSTLPAVNGVMPTGTVTFENGYTAIGTGTLNGSGVATLTTGSLPVGSDTLIAVYGGDTNFSAGSSNTVTETVSKNGGAGTLSTSNAGPSYGQSVTLTDALPAVNGTVPTGTVTFYNGASAIGTGTVNASGVATFATGTLPVGTDSVTAVYGGDANYASTTSNAVTETVSKSSGAGTLTTSNATPGAGQTVTFTDTLPVVNGVAPTGAVTFASGGTTLGTGAISSTGVATLQTTALPIGTDSVTATYAGDTNYAAGNSNAVTETVSKNSSAGTLSSSNTAPAYGQPITFSDTLPPVNGIAPTGTVTFYNGAAVLGTATVNGTGVAALTTGSLPVGTDSITAMYGGDANFASTTSNAVTETVTKNAGSNTLSTSNATPSYGQSVTLTDTPMTANGVVPTGTVTFYNGTSVIGTGMLSSSGVATLATSALPVGTDSLSAVFGGDASYSSSTSNTLTETVAKNSNTGTLSTSNAAPVFGQSITLTDTLPAVNGATPTGTVTFYNGAAALGTGTVNAAGIATLSTNALPVGTDSVTAVYGGDTNYSSTTSNAVTETVSKSSGTGTLTSSNASPAYGQPITLTDSLPAVNGVVPTGTVTFYNGAAVLGAGNLNGSGVATLTSGTLPVGSDSITAVYAGDSNYSGFTAGPLTETVSKASSTGTLSTSNASPTFGQTVTLTDTFSAVNGATPTGTVTFFNGNNSLGSGTVNSSGIASLTTNALPVGTDAITAVYDGDGNYKASTSNVVNENVTKSSGTGTLITSNPDPSFGQSVTFTNTLPSVNGVVPTGSVTFYNGSSALGTVSLNGSGVATLSTAALPVGTDSVTAGYSGDANYSPVTSNTVAESVGKNTGTGVLTTSNGSPNAGQTVTLTDMLPAVNGIEPTGLVTFYNGASTIGTGTVNNAGVATLSTGALPVGSDSVTAVYSGDANYASTTSNAVTETVAKNTGAGTLSASSTSPSYGQSVSLTDTLPTVGGLVPTGTVTFYNGSTAVGTGVVNGSGVATLATGSLPVGVNSITAQYGGDGNYSANTSNAVTITVSKSAGTGTLTSSNSAPSYGQSVTLTDTLPSVNGVPPTGTVTFFSGTNALGTGTVSASGVATLATNALPVGSDAVTAVYGGDTSYSANTSNALTETVAKSSGSGTLTTSNAAPTAGQSVTLTDTLPIVNGVVPTGTVTFYNGNAAIGTGTVNASGVATLATSSLPVGNDAVSAVYGGDANYASSTSNTLHEIVSRTSESGTLTASTTTPTYGQTVTLTDTLPAANGIFPTGTVTFSSGTTVLGTGTVNSAGVATLGTGSLPVGTDSVTASYGGDEDFSSGTSNTVAITVAKSTGTDALTSSNTAPTYGQTITLTDTLSLVNGTVPTGTVTFYNGTAAIGTGAVNSSGVATLTTGALPVGTDSVTASFAGDANYSASTSNAVIETVGRSSGSDLLTSSNSAPTVGQTITLTDTLPTVNAVAPTGTVTFYNGSTAIGTGTVNGAGVATLTTGALPVGSDAITAVYGGDPNYSADTSNVLTETVGKINATTTLTTSNATPNVGQTVTLTDTIATVNGIVPTGTVTFSLGKNVLGTATVNSSGVAILATNALPVGVDSVTAIYSGDANYGSSTSNVVTETVSKTGAAGTLTASTTSPSVGQSITLTDTLPVVNNVVPTGTVTFYNGATSLGTGVVSASGVATLSTASLPIGTDAITAVYGGDGTYSANTAGPLDVTVGKMAGSSTLSTSNAAPTAGQSVTFTDTVTLQNGIVPTGLVTFYNGTTALGTGTVNASGIATLATNALPVGSDSVTAVYAGDTNYASSTSNPVTETVGKNTGGSNLTTSNATPTFGQSVTLTDTLPSSNGFTPTGAVTFYNGTAALGSAALNASGVATLTTNALPVGSDSVTAVYAGDAGNAASTSNAVTETVAKSPAPDTLTTSNAAPNYGQAVTFSATIPAVDGIAPSGTVTFSNGNTIIGTGVLDNAGVASLTTSSLPAGTDSVTASFLGDANYSASTSNAVVETVAKSAGTGTLTSSNLLPSAGQPVTFTDSLPIANSLVPTGSVTFSTGSVTLGTATVNGSGVATLTTGALPVGVDAVTAVYGGDASYSSSPSNAVTENVSKNIAAGTLTASNLAPSAGQPVTLTVSQPTVNGVVPTGSVNFFSNGTLIGTGTLNNAGVATLTTSSLPSGSDKILAVYVGDASYDSTSPPPLTVTVGRAASSDVLTTSNTAPTVGQPVTLTATVPTVNGIVPTGTVSFLNGGTAIGTGTLNASGVASLTTSSLPAGVDTITASYAGDTDYSASTSNAVTETVSKAPGASTLTSSAASSSYGQPLTFTDTVNTVNGSPATGTVTFFDGNTVLGTGTMNASGVATLTTSALPVGTDLVTATYGGDVYFAPTTSNAVSEAVSPGASTALLTTSNSSPTLGQTVTLTDTLSLLNGKAPTGIVTFSSGSTVVGTGTVNSSGLASLSTAALPLGMDTVTATYSGDGTFAPVTSNAISESVSKSTDTGTLTTSNPNPSFGQPVLFTDTLPVVNSVVPSGVVTFYNGSTSIGTGVINNAGIATLSTGALPVGAETVTAVYGGDSTYSGATSNAVPETVTRNVGTGTLVTSNATPATGQSVTLTDTLSAVNGVVPTGTVTFNDGTTVLGTGQVNRAGVASLTTTSLPVGTSSVTAVFGGDATYRNNVSNAVTEMVAKGTAGGVLTTSNPAPTVGQAVTLTDTLSQTGGVLPTGTVTFLQGTTTLGTSAVNGSGVAVLTTSSLPLGTETVTAVYGGDANEASSTSNAVSEVVSKSVANITLTSSGATSVLGQPVTLTATAAPVNGVYPTGSINFMDGSTSLGTGTINAGGVATLTTSSLPTGTNTVSASYGGDNRFGTSVSNAVTETVTKPVVAGPIATTGKLTSSAPSTVFGQPVTLTETLAGLNGVVPTGSVTFYNGPVAIGTATVNASGVAVLTLSTLPVGNDSITASYTGDLAYLPLTSGPVAQTVTPAPMDFTIGATPAVQTINPGDTTSYTISLAGLNAAFSAPITLSVTGLPPGATVSFNPATLTPGTGTGTTTMTIVTSPLQAKMSRPGSGVDLRYGFLLLPLLGLGRVRRRLRALPVGVAYCLAGLALLGSLGVLTGCGGGFFGVPPHSYKITVTGTSASLVHSTTVTLTVE